MKARIVIAVTLLTLVGGLCVTFYGLGREHRVAIERYRPLAEKLRTHCYYVASTLRQNREGLEAPNGIAHDAAASGIDLFVRSTEQLDVCLDGPRDFDNLPCLLTPTNDCRRAFVKYYLDTIPERYQTYAPLD